MLFVFLMLVFLRALSLISSLSFPIFSLLVMVFLVFVLMLVLVFVLLLAVVVGRLFLPLCSFPIRIFNMYMYTE